jgi:hypothetical protein
MANLIIKPSAGGDLKLQDEGSTDAITISTTGNTTLAGTANNLGTVTAGNLSHASIVYPDEVVFSGEHNTTYTSDQAVLVWDVGLYDPENGHSSGVYTIPKAGDYLIIITGKGDSGNTTASATGVRIFKGSVEQDSSAAVGYQSADNSRLQYTENHIISCDASNTITAKTYLEGAGNSNNVHGGLITIARMGV